MPWLKFYPSDWRGSSKMGRCSHELRGIWLEVMCLMHASADYGVLRWPLEDVARTIGTSTIKLEKLREYGLLKGAAEGSICSPLNYTPVSGRSKGPTVTLIPAQSGDIWYCARMVRDEYVRRAKAGSHVAPNTSPMPPIGDDSGDAPDQPPSSRASAPTQSPEAKKEDSKTLVPGKPETSDCPHLEIIEAYHRQLPMLTQVRSWNEDRKVKLRARWRESPERQSVQWWSDFFAYVATCPFLLGNHNSQNNPNWQADLEWLVSPKNFAKVIEGKFEPKPRAAA